MIEEDPIFETRGTVAPGKNQGARRNTERHRRIMAVLERSGVAGATAREVVEEMHRVFDAVDYHGPISGALSRMKQHGDIVQLRKKRGGFSIYVLPEHVNDRPAHPAVKEK